MSASINAVSNLVPETVGCFEVSIPESCCKESFIFFTGRCGEDNISLNEDSEDLWPCVQESGADGRQELVCSRQLLVFPEIAVNWSSLICCPVKKNNN